VFFLHFGQFHFYRRQVCNKRLANWTAITDTLTQWIYKECKAWVKFLEMVKSGLELLQ